MYTVLLRHRGPNGEVVREPRAIYETEIGLAKERAAALLRDAQKEPGILPDRYHLVDETTKKIVAKGAL